MALTASTIVVVVVVVDDALFALTVCSTCYTLLMKEELINDLCYYPRESIVCMYSSLKVDNNNNNMNDIITIQMCEEITLIYMNE